MTEQFTRLARDRLEQLSTTLTTLRERVRDAVASEMGKAVGEAIRDLLTAILNRQVPRFATPPMPLQPSAPSQSSSRWDDDDEPGWYDDLVPSTPRPFVEPVQPSPTVPPVDALRLGVGLARWLLQRRMPIFAGLGVGIAAGLATLSNNPIVQTGLAVIAAASELFAITEFASNVP
ncbi:hypothetical protein BH11PLA2_BH11PLA2_48650 [soil metagenome]